MIKVLERIEIQRIHLNIIKAKYRNPTANIILNMMLYKYKINFKKLMALPLKSGTSQRCSLFPFLFNAVHELLAGAIRQ